MALGCVQWLAGSGRLDFSIILWPFTSTTFYYVKPYLSWPPGASGRVRGFGWSVCIKKCTSGSSGVDWCVVAAARRQNLVRRASGAPPDVAIRGWLGALSLLRGAFFCPGALPTEVVFRKVGLSKWLWTVDVEKRDQKLESKVCWRCCAVHFVTLWMRVHMA